MAQLIRWIRSHPAAAILAGSVAVSVALGGGLGIARATDSPAFCRAACHEMRPYADAWQEGPHADIACVECHVDPGTLPRLTHKVEALKEVAAHVKGGVTFPMAETKGVPDERCVRCHEDVVVDRPGFSHAEHASRGPCQGCHRDAGHSVRDQALKKAGIFNSSAKRSSLSGRVAVVGQGSNNVPRHIRQNCSGCHDMRKTGCGSCHEPKHARGGARKNGECTTCHDAGPRFVFAHPRASAGCESCHARPAEHRTGACESCHVGQAKWAFAHPSQGDCGTCHERPARHRTGECRSCHPKAGISWAFAHPGQKASCTGCHARPAGHRSGACVRCHKTGVTWAFSHPRRTSNCASCHVRPAAHRSGSCTSCHAQGSWAFRHPGSSSTCTSCHNRPAGHRSGSCLTCHRVARAWTFRHPTSSACASCHRPPSNHYGSSCGRCHAPTRAWRNATFSHARIPGGEHTYRSFACSSCHPRGYTSNTCIKCHDRASGPSDD